MGHSNLFERMQAQAERSPEALALLAPGQRPMTFGGLLAQMRATVERLNALGIGRGDRAALVAPNGPALAAAFLGTAAGAVCVPLNPAYTADEFRFYLHDLKVKAVIVPAGSGAPAAAAARALGLQVLTLHTDDAAPAGTFTLAGEARRLASAGGPGAADDTALLLHTSGTTARPKRVPRTHAELLAATRDYHAHFDFTPANRCLNILPLYHIHGLVTSVLAPLTAGASVVCTPGFSATHFFDWLAEFEPTWFNAGPAVLQAIVDVSRTRRPALSAPGLRFIRSGSASLAPALLAEVEQLFGVPVLEGYGLSEGVPLACNPLPPRPRKAGSVGPPAGPDIAIMSPDSGERLPAGAVGEIVARGPSLMRGYDDDPEANALAFAGDWFRTGDLGYLDEDGYLFITGRLKEQINSGGEKIAPAEVEAALQAHPAVRQAAAFAIPAAGLGEAVGAAVVLEPGAAAEEAALRQFAAARLASFKVPRRVVCVPELPTGPTGKILRTGLAQRLKLTDRVEDGAAPASAPPADEVEQALAAIWRQVLNRARVGRHERFLDLGGDSLMASQVVARASEAFGLDLSLAEFLEAATVAEQAALVAVLQRAASEPLEAAGRGHSAGSL